MRGEILGYIVVMIGSDNLYRLAGSKGGREVRKKGIYLLYLTWSTSNRRGVADMNGHQGFFVLYICNLSIKHGKVQL